MSYIGSSSVRCAVDPASRALSFHGACWTRQGVIFTFSGHDRAPTDLVVVANRRGVFVGGISAGQIAGTTASASGLLDTNTEELEALLIGLRRGDIAKVELQLWDSNVSSLELLGVGELEIACSGLGYTASTGATPVTPIVGSTGTLGAFGWANGKIYFRNDDMPAPTNWYPVELRGAAGTMYIDYSQSGVAL